MNFAEQLSAVGLLIVFLLGVAFGVFGGVAYGSAHDDRRRTLLGSAPGPMTAGARAILGLHTSSDRYMRSLLARGGSAAADKRHTRPIGIEGQESRQ